MLAHTIAWCSPWVWAEENNQKSVLPDNHPGPRCESLVEIYSQLQQEIGAASGELEPKTRASLISRLDEVLRTLVTRYIP